MQTHDPTAAGRPPGGAGSRIAALQRQLRATPDDPALRLELAGLLERAGRAAESLEQTRLAVRCGPGQALPLYALGLRLHAAHYFEDALAHYRRALEHEAGHPDWWLNCGRAALAAGAADEAIDALQRAIADPRLQPQAQLDLARARLAAGQTEAALRTLPAPLADPRSEICRAEILVRLGRIAAALRSARSALAATPTMPGAHYWLARALIASGDTGSARSHLLAAVQADPEHAEACTSLAELSASEQRDGEARDWLARARAAQDLRRILQQQRTLESAILRYEWAIAEQQERGGSAHPSLAGAAESQDRLEKALQRFEALAGRRPDYSDRLRTRYAVTHYNIANALLEQSLPDRALEHFEQALRLDPEHVEAESNLLLALNYPGDLDERQIAARHRAFGARHDGREVPLPARTGARRLRIGYLSADLRRHSVAFFVEPLLREHDRDAWEVYCYSNNAQVDATTQRLQALADVWRETHMLDDSALVELIRSDAIDVLVELNGHTGGNRLRALARRAAALQVSWLGYPNTTGLAAMDYRLTDALADPPGESDELHSERLLRLPGCFCCYQPPEQTPAVAARPARQGGAMTFGSFNHFPKMTGQVLRTWAGLLARVPNSRLILKNSALGERRPQRYVQEIFAAEGVAAERLELLGHLAATRDHLDLYNRIDIALDPFPYNGTTTTCEALWMGCPVVTLAGRAHRSRVGLSLLTAVGLERHVARSIEQYTDIACSLAADAPGLAALREQLRSMLQRSALCDAAGFAQRLQATLRKLVDETAV